jgi:hypothetical protein
VVLEFFGARGYRACGWFDPAWMREHAVYSDEGLVEALRGCSWGIVVTDLEAEDIRYSKFSFPGKFGIYLAAGVPVLGFGHPSSSQAEVMRTNKAGRFTSARNGADLEQFLAESLALSNPRAFFRNEILACARTEFDVRRMRALLWKTWGAR